MFHGFIISNFSCLQHNILHHKSSLRIIYLDSGFVPMVSPSSELVDIIPKCCNKNGATTQSSSSRFLTRQSLWEIGTSAYRDLIHPLQNRRQAGVTHQKSLGAHHYPIPIEASTFQDIFEEIHSLKFRSPAISIHTSNLLVSSLTILNCLKLVTPSKVSSTTIHHQQYKKNKHHRGYPYITSSKNERGLKSATKYDEVTLLS